MNSVFIVALVTLTWSVNFGYGADIVDSGNFFDRLNPIRSIVGAQSYDNAKLNAFTLPSRMIQGISNIALAPWRGNDFSSRGGKLPNLNNLFSGLPIVGTVLGGSRGSRGSRGSGNANNYGPMAQVEMARAPGSGSASASASGQNSGRSSGSASASTSANLSGQSAGYPSLPNNFFASLPMPSAPGQGSRNQGSTSSASQSSRPSSPSSASVSSPSSDLPSIPNLSSSTLGSPSSSSSTPQLPSLNLGPQSASPIPTASGSASNSIDPAIAQALNGFGFNLNGLNLGGSFGVNSQSPSSGASASVGGPGQPQASASASSGGSSSLASSLFNSQPTGQAQASAGSGSSGLVNGFSSLFSGGGSSSTPGIGQASNFLSNLFNYPLTG